MATSMRIALAQLNTVVGDLPGNEARVARAIDDAREAGAALVATPELALSGYPPEDLLFKEHFLASARAALDRVAGGVGGGVGMGGFS
jgi:NAD+ synthase (glutamine-hydrolysing)